MRYANPSVRQLKLTANDKEKLTIIENQPEPIHKKEDSCG